MMFFNLSAVGLVLLAFFPSTFLKCSRICLYLSPAQFLLLALHLQPPLPLCPHHMRPFLEPIFSGRFWCLAFKHAATPLLPHVSLNLLSTWATGNWNLQNKMQVGDLPHILQSVTKEGEIRGIKKLDSYGLRKFFYSWAALSGLAVWLWKPTEVLNISSIFQGRFTSMHCWFENASISLD